MAWRCAVVFQSVPRTLRNSFQTILGGIYHFLVDSERKVGLTFFESGQKLTKMTWKHPPHAPITFWVLGAHTQLFWALSGIFRIFSIFTLKNVLFFKELSKPDFFAHNPQKSRQTPTNPS